MAHKTEEGANDQVLLSRDALAAAESTPPGRPWNNFFDGERDPPLAYITFPLLLRKIADIKGVNWASLANIGQTYGAASAILSAIALIVIAFPSAFSSDSQRPSVSGLCGIAAYSFLRQYGNRPICMGRS